MRENYAISVSGSNLSLNIGQKDTTIGYTGTGIALYYSIQSIDGCHASVTEFSTQTGATVGCTVKFGEA